MFDTITRRPRHATVAKRLMTVAVSVLAHAVVLTATVLLPLWYFTPTLPTPTAVMAFVAAPPAPPPPPPPPPPARSRASRHAPATPTPATHGLAAPIDAPSRIEPENAIAQTDVIAGVVGGVEGGVPGGVVGGIVGGLRSSPPPPPPPRPPAPKPVPVRVGGEIKAPTLITRVDPEYPPIAQAAQLEGIVILEATVDPTGRVEALTVLRSAGLLDAAAIEAVKQWRYSPLRLNGQPTSFVLTVTVQFHLAHTT